MRRIKPKGRIHFRILHSFVHKLKMLSSKWIFTVFVLLGVYEISVESSLSPERDLLLNFQRPSLEKLNELRAEYDLNPMTLDDELNSGAQNWAEEEARKHGKLTHSCNPCENFSELLAEKVTTGKVPKGRDAVDWALGRWFGALLNGEEPEGESANAYSALIKRRSLSQMGIGIAYGVREDGKKTVFAVARFSSTKPTYG